MSSERMRAERRARRLDQLKATQSVKRANAALHQTWQAGRRPDYIRLRTGLVELPEKDKRQPVLTQLIRPRGLALRFYLLAIFEAQCRLEAGEKWTSSRHLSGPASWADLIAVDGAYSTQAEKYMRDTKQRRTLADQRLRQVRSALQTLEAVGTRGKLVPGSGGSQALVSVPLEGAVRQYKEFVLLNELGRGELQTMEPYSVPHPRYGTTFRVPADFFLKGWIHVLSDAEISVWLTLMSLFNRYPGKHREEGIYLYAARRSKMGLRRDSWEDGCARLRDFGLIRYAVPPAREEKKVVASGEQSPEDYEASVAEFIEGFAEFDFSRPEPPAVYEPDRHQLLKGFVIDALNKVMMETTLRVKSLN